MYVLSRSKAAPTATLLFLCLPFLSSRAPCRRPTIFTTVWQDRPRSEANPQGKGSEGRPLARPSLQPFFRVLLLGKWFFSSLSLSPLFSYPLFFASLWRVLVVYFSFCLILWVKPHQIGSKFLLFDVEKFFFFIYCLGLICVLFVHFWPIFEV